jgi:tetratricopeptide (TPR) repeat protein
MSGGLQIKKHVESLIGFLKDPKPEVRFEAAQNVSGFAGSDGGRATLMSADTMSVVKGISNLVGDLDQIAQQALTALINLTSHPQAVADMLECGLFQKLMESLKSGDDAGNRRLNLILLSNLTQPASGALRMLQADAENRALHGLNVLRLISWFVSNSAKATTSNVTNSVEDEDEEAAMVVNAAAEDEDEWKYVAGILANVTRLKEGRDIVLDLQRGVLNGLLPELHSPSLLRRQGMARVLRNICFERHKVMWMMTDVNIDILYHIMKRLSGREPLREGEYDENYPDLYDDAQVREPDVQVRQILVDCLVLLASSSRNARDLMRKRKVYPVVREMHSDTNEIMEQQKRKKQRAKVSDSTALKKREDGLVEIDQEANAPTKFDEAMFKLVDYLQGEEGPENTGATIEVLDDDKDHTTAPAAQKVYGDVEDELPDHLRYPAIKNESLGLKSSAPETHFAMNLAAQGGGDDDDDSSSEDDCLPGGVKKITMDEDSEDENDLPESEQTDAEMKAAMKEALAMEYKDKGNGMYKAGDYEKAIEWYSRAIEAGASSKITVVCYSNRSAAQTLKRRYVEAEADAKTCMSMSPEFPRGYCRLAKAYEKQGLIEDALGVLEQGLRKLPKNKMLDDEKIKLVNIRSEAAEKKKTKLEAARKRREKEEAEKKNATYENTLSRKVEAGAQPEQGLLNLSVDSSKMSKEEIAQLQELMGQYETTKRESRQANMQAGQFEYEKKMDGLTLKEVEALDVHRNTYRSIGKIYIRQPLPQIKEQIKSDIKKREAEYASVQSKIGFINKRLVSLEGELKDFVGAINAR